VSHLEHRLSRLEQELVAVRRRSTMWKLLAGGALLALAVGPAIGTAGGSKRALTIASPDGRHELDLHPDHLEFSVDGQSRMKLEVGEDWSSYTMHAPSGNVAYLVGQDGNGTSMRIFAPDGALRVEVAEHLLDSGSGIRVYDPEGNPRATLFSNKRGGESGVEMVDPNRQPRIGVYAKPNGVSVLRANTSAADAEIELSILPQSDAVARETGGIPYPVENEPFVPMLFISDTAGHQKLITTHSE